MWRVATAMQHGARLKIMASCCDLPQRQYFGDLFDENRGVFSYDKNPHLPQKYKKQRPLEKVQKEPEKKEKQEEGDRRSGLGMT